MRIRTIKPDFFTDRKVRSLKFHERLLFQGLWLIADDEGRLEEDHAVIKGFLFPSDSISVPRGIDRLVEKGMLLRYEADAVKYLQVRNFKCHQVVNKPRKSKLPPPPESEIPGTLPETSGSRAEKPPDESVRKGMEGKGREGKGICQSYRSSTSNASKPRTATGPASGNSNGQGKGPGNGQGKGPGDGQSDRQILEMLEPFFPRAAIEKLLEEFPPQRLLWAADRTRAAGEVRKIKKHASYLLRILRDNEQWERYVCDQYALGKAEARRRQRDLAQQRRKRDYEISKHKNDVENARLVRYVASLPKRVAESVAEMALKAWAAQNSIDLDDHRKKGWLPRVVAEGIFKTQVKGAWKQLGKPAQFTAVHLGQLQRKEKWSK